MAVKREGRGAQTLSPVTQSLRGKRRFGRKRQLSRQCVPSWSRRVGAPERARLRHKQRRQRRRTLPTRNRSVRRRQA